MNEKQLKTLLEMHETPAYVFDIGVLKARVAYLRSHLPGEVSLCYAMKANTFVVQELRDCIDRFEVCSPGEYEICQALELPMEKLVISGVNKSADYIERVAAESDRQGVYTVESLSQFRLLKAAAQRTGQRFPVLLRLTSGNQFGMSEDEIRTLIRRRLEYPCIDFLGIQYYSGTQKHSMKRLERELHYLEAFLLSLRQEFDYTARELEFGPGFPIFYFQGEEFDEDHFLTEFSALLGELQISPHITLEVGRSVAASCGTYLTRVMDTKVNGGQNYAILDGGIHQLVYFGQTMAMRQPVYDIFPPREESLTESWNLCGSLCTVNDMLVKQLPVEGLRVGDVFAFRNTGAYCITEGISLFLSRALPQVLLLTESGEFLPVRDAVETHSLNTPNYQKEICHNG